MLEIIFYMLLGFVVALYGPTALIILIVLIVFHTRKLIDRILGKKPKK